MVCLCLCYCFRFWFWLMLFWVGIIVTGLRCLFVCLCGYWLFQFVVFVVVVCLFGFWLLVLNCLLVLLIDCFVWIFIVIVLWQYIWSFVLRVLFTLIASLIIDVIAFVLLVWFDYVGYVVVCLLTMSDLGCFIGTDWCLFDFMLVCLSLVIVLI